MLIAVLRAAREHANARAEAWALHQSRDPRVLPRRCPGAIAALEEALQLREQLADPAATATRHNLDFIRGTNGGDDGEANGNPGPGPRPKALAALAVLALLIAVSITAVVRGSDGGSSVATPTPTAATPTPTPAPPSQCANGKAAGCAFDSEVPDSSVTPAPNPTTEPTPPPADGTPVAPR